MTYLSDKNIREELRESLRIESHEPDAVRPASVDLRLFRKYLYYPAGGVVDHKRGRRPEPMVGTMDAEHGLWFYPGEWMLAATLESVHIPAHLIGILCGKSSIARDGLSIENAGFVDPGWTGRLTLELKNLGNLTYILYPGQYICQIRFAKLASVPELSYAMRRDSHYMNSEGPVMSLGQTSRRIHDHTKLDDYGRWKENWSDVEPAPIDYCGEAEDNARKKDPR